MSAGAIPSPVSGTQTSPKNVKSRKRATSAPPKPLQERNFDEIAFVISGGIALAFNSGYINGCCMSGLFATGAPKQGVAGFTGDTKTK